MKQILKHYGMPRTGTNLLYWLLTLNFKNYVCDIGEHNVQYLGWKHGVPPSNLIIECIKKYTNEQPLFVFTNRKYETWSNAIKTRHQNTWEFLSKFSNKDFWFYYTPVGFEIYKNDLDFYIQRQNIYKEFCQKHSDISIMVNFEDLQNNQEQVVKTIQNKFNLERCSEQIVSIKKQLNSSGQFLDYR